MKWLLVTLASATAVFAAAQNAQLPDGEGKALVNSACTSCHGLDLITPKQAPRDEWAGIVDRMKNYGVTLDANQTTTMLDYLAKNFGPNKPAGGDAAGKKALDSYCGGCHDLDLATGRTGTKSEWQEIVERMNARGAGVPDGEVAPLIDYLTKTYPPKN